MNYHQRKTAIRGASLMSTAPDDYYASTYAEVRTSDPAKVSHKPFY
ncbi:hypothetical protein FVEN_g13010 [Fusarium venenatum]|nr:hypothetical protein FVEN_g13010 [Fusarium venenatum]